MSTFASQYLATSQLDFLGPFSNLWIGFNSWYQNLYPEESDQAGCLSMRATFAPAVDAQVNELHQIDSFIANEVDLLSACKCASYTYSHDTSGFKFRLRCQNSSAVTNFLQRSKKHPLLSAYTSGLRFFELIGKPDALFQSLYRKYRGWEASPEGMSHSADASRITSNLNGLGVQHFGHMLFHNFVTSKGKTLFVYEDVFGPLHSNLVLAANISTRKEVVQKYGENSPESFAWELRRKARDVTSLYLLIIYKFRCLYFHGNIDPHDRLNQELAQSAFFSLRGLMEATHP